MPESSAIVLYDGVCNLCNGFVQFILPRDPRGQFQFCSLQSDAARVMLKDSTVDPSALSTVVLLEKDHLYTESTAILRIARRLGGLWFILYALIVVPPFARDAVYRWVARNRYRVFGKREECLLPKPEWKDRFLG